MKKLLICLSLCTLLSACVPPPDNYTIPEFELPEHAREQEQDHTRWWENFNDPVLNAIVQEALENNDDVRMAAAQLQQARSTHESSLSTLFPTIGVEASRIRNQVSFDNGIPIFPGQPRIFEYYTGGAAISYEIDFWGRLASMRQGFERQAEASVYMRALTQSVVAADVVRTYLTLRALDREESVLNKTLQTREKAVALQRKRIKAGLIDAYVFSLVKAEREAAATALPPIQAAREQMEIGLAELVGRSPKEISEHVIQRGKPIRVLSHVPDVPKDLSSDLLTRRPDVIAAEHLLWARNSSVNEARTAWLPTISLSGFFGGESIALGNVLRNSAQVWNVAPTITQPITELWTTQRRVDLAKGVRKEAEITYQKTVRRAFADVLTALSAHKGANDTLWATKKLFKNQKKVKNLAVQQFKAGRIGRLDVLDAERERLNAERALIAARRDKALALVNVYQALGGGWSIEEPES